MALIQVRGLQASARGISLDSMWQYFNTESNHRWVSEQATPERLDWCIPNVLKGGPSLVGIFWPLLTSNSGHAFTNFKNNLMWGMS